MYVQSDTSVLADVFETFWKMCLEIYKLDPACFLTTAELAWKTSLKKTKIKLDYLTDIDMLLMVQKGVKGRICHVIYQYVQANNKYEKLE